MPVLAYRLVRENLGCWETTGMKNKAVPMTNGDTEGRKAAWD